MSCSTKNTKKLYRSTVEMGISVGILLPVLLCVVLVVTVFYNLVFAAGTVSIENQQFGFTFEVPTSWQVEKNRDKDSLVLDTQNNDQTGALTVLAVNLQKPLPLESFIFWAEEEISKDLSFVNAGTRREVVPSEQEEDANHGLIFYEYLGKFLGYEITTVVGYRVKSLKGYALLTTWIGGDTIMKQQLKEMIASFKLSDSAAISSTCNEDPGFNMLEMKAKTTRSSR